MVSSLYASASTCVVCASPDAGPPSAVVPVFVDLGAGPSSGADAAMVGRSLTSLVPAFSTLSRSCDVVIWAGILPGGTSDAGALNTATFFCQLAST